MAMVLATALVAGACGGVEVGEDVDTEESAVRNQGAVYLCVWTFVSYYPYYITQPQFGGFTIDPADYLARYPDLRNAYGTDLWSACEHFKKWGINERRQASPVFDINYYLARYPDVKAAGNNSPTFAINHWYRYGRREGRQGSATFSSSHYLQMYPDIKAMCGATGYECAINHYLIYGRDEGRKGTL